MKNIIIALPDDNLGGAEQYLKMVAEYYFNSGYTIDVFFLKGKVTGAWDYLQTERFKLHFTNSQKEKYGVFVLFKNLIKQDRFDLAFTSHVHLNSFVSLLRKCRILKVTYHIARESNSTFERYKGLQSLLFRAYYKISYNKINLLICQSEEMRDQLYKALPELFKQTKVIDVPNPIDLENCVRREPDNTLPYGKFIVSAGRLIPEKGFDILIDAFNKLQLDYPDYNLVIAGKGKMHNYLVEKANELGLSSKVHLVGFQKNIYSFFRQAKMCVVSSRLEGFPNVLLQMMANNEKVVSTLCAGGIEEIQGLEISRDKSQESLYLAMKSCLAADTTNNRTLFDKQLEMRSIRNFVKRVEMEIM